MNGSSPCVLLCVTGCIAAYKSCEIVRLLQKSDVRVKVLMTEHATHFVDPTTFRALTNEKVAIGLFDDPEDPIHHISLAQEADLVLVAPATANIIAKMAHGIADDLMSTTLLATRAPIAIAPAMNSAMWEAPVTQSNVALLQDRGCHVIRPSNGRLACGDVGSGKLADVEAIVRGALGILRPSTALAGKRVLITAGGTQEAIDPVRYIGNRSSGRFGYALARAAVRMGAEVTLVSGPTQLAAPRGCDIVPVVSAADMLSAVEAAFDSADMLICAAAVADYTPKSRADHKLKKDTERLDLIELVETQDILATMAARKGSRVVIGFADYTPKSRADHKLKKDTERLDLIELVETQDILATMAARKGSRVVIGFAAETDALLDHARAKLLRKGCDAIIANDVSRPDSTFGSATDKVWWITPESCEELPLMTKERLAPVLLERAGAFFK